MARPSKFKPEFIEQAMKLCRLGATDLEIAQFFGVAERTINTWKAQHVEFALAMRRGKEESDDRVEHSLYRLAIGYAHEAVKIYADPKSGKQKTVKYIEQHPPNATACIFWLKNRRSDVWRDKLDIDTGLTRERATELLAVVERRLAELAPASAGAAQSAPVVGKAH